MDENELTPEDKQRIRDQYLTVEVIEALSKNEFGLATDATELRDLLHRTILTFDELLSGPSEIGIPIFALMPTEAVMVMRALMAQVHAVVCDKTAEHKADVVDADPVLAMLRQVFSNQDEMHKES